MDKTLQNQLYEKYPKLFAEKDLPPSETCMCWGICFDSGWYQIIDCLCESIQSYIDARLRSVDFYNKQNLPIPDWCKPIEQVVFLQLKEKLGTLRAYCRGGDEITSGMIFLAENLSSRICEVCGSTKNVVCQSKKNGFWIKSLCSECYEES